MVDAVKGEVEKRISTKRQLSRLVARHPNSNFAYACNIVTNDISVIDVEEGVLTKTIRPEL